MCLKFTTVLLSAKMGVLRTTFVTETVGEVERSCRGSGEKSSLKFRELSLLFEVESSLRTTSSIFFSI